MAIAALVALLERPGATAAADPADAVAPPESEDQLDLDLGWDDGPTYELWLRFPELRRADEFGIVQDFGVRGRLGGQIFLDGGYVWGEGYDDDFQREMRRLRFHAKGEISYWRRTGYKIAFGAENGDFYLNDFYVSQRFDPGVLVRIGYFDPPFSIQALTGSTERTFLENAAASAAFAPGYRLGIDVRRRRVDPDLTWWLSLSSVGQSQEFSDSSDSPLRLSGRLAWRPGATATSADAPLLHVGAAASYTFSGSGSVQYRARPESVLGPYLADTDEIDGNAWQAGLEVAARRGETTLQGELIGAFVDGDDTGSLAFWGVYVQSARALTGESRPYDTECACFGRLVPEAPFSWSEGGIGAIELAARLSWLDLSDGPVRGGRMLTFHAGAIWTWNAWVRVLGGYVYAHVDDRGAYGANHILQGRLEFQL